MSPWIVDALLAALVLAHSLTGLRRPPSVFDSTVVLAVAVVLVWRRTAPLPILLASGGAYLALEASGHAVLHPLPFVLLVVLYTVATRRPLAASGAVGAVLGVAALAAAVVQPGPLAEDEFLDQLIALTAAWTLGAGVRLNRIRTALLEDGARRVVREQAVQTRLAVELERARIARELHDIVAHHVSVIVAQAGATKRVFDTQPEHARAALGTIETVGREALTEMRRLLSVLSSADDDAHRGPQPGLAQMRALVAKVEGAELPVDLDVRGSPRRLPPGVELNAYRIVQESLTNALKHAGPARARVVLDYHPDALELQISDDGLGATPAAGDERAGRGRHRSDGHGLVGMRERAAMLGGELTVGPRPGGGFQVSARLPVEG